MLSIVYFGFSSSRLIIFTIHLIILTPFLLHFVKCFMNQKHNLFKSKAVTIVAPDMYCHKGTRGRCCGPGRNDVGTQTIISKALDAYVFNTLDLNSIIYYSYLGLLYKRYDFYKQKHDFKFIYLF